MKKINHIIIARERNLLPMLMLVSMNLDKILEWLNGGNYKPAHSDATHELTSLQSPFEWDEPLYITTTKSGTQQQPEPHEKESSLHTLEIGHWNDLPSTAPIGHTPLAFESITEKYFMDLGVNYISYLLGLGKDIDPLDPGSQIHFPDPSESFTKVIENIVIGEIEEEDVPSILPNNTPTDPDEEIAFTEESIKGEHVLEGFKLEGASDPDGDDVDVHSLNTASIIGTYQGVNAALHFTTEISGMTVTIKYDGNAVLTLIVDPETGTETATSMDDAFWNGMAEGDSLSIKVGYTVTDGHGGFDNSEQTINILGSNDCPTVELTMLDLDTLKEDNAVAGDDLTGNVITDSGAVDLDGDPLTVSNPFSEDLIVAGINVGKITIHADGSYEIDLDEVEIQKLNDAAMQDFSYTVYLTDGKNDHDSQDICEIPVELKFSIMGQNDCPTVELIMLDLDTLKEDTAVAGDDLTGNVITDSGASDIDDGDVITVNFVGLVAVDDLNPFTDDLIVDGHDVGDITIHADGSYEIDLDEVEIQKLNDAAMQDFSYTVYLTDGKNDHDSQDICEIPVELKFSIMGQNDCPTVELIMLDLDTLKEDTAVAGDDLTGNVITDSGASDIDDGDVITVNFVGLVAVDDLNPFTDDLIVDGHDVGNITIHADGSYEIDLDEVEIQKLNDAAMQDFSYTVYLTDGKNDHDSQDICEIPVELKFSIMGQNDCPTVELIMLDLDTLKEDTAVAGDDLTGNVITDSGASDIDDGDVITVNFVGLVAVDDLNPFTDDLIVDGHDVGDITIHADGSYEIDLDEVEIQKLNDAAMQDFSYTVYLTDGKNDHDSQDICEIPVELKFSIMGQNDCPTVELIMLMLDSIGEDDTTPIMGNVIDESVIVDPDSDPLMVVSVTYDGTEYFDNGLNGDMVLGDGIINVIIDEGQLDVVTNGPDAGKYTFTLNNGNVQYLNSGDQLSLPFLILVTDGRLDPESGMPCHIETELVIKIDGDNDNLCPVIGNPNIMNMLFEASTTLNNQDHVVEVPSVPIDGNVITEAGIVDPDGDPIIFLSVNGVIDGGSGDADGMLNGIIKIEVEYGGQHAGTLTLDVANPGNGNYTFALDDTNQFINALSAGETIQFDFNILLTDGGSDPDHPQEQCMEDVNLSIVIKGLDDLIETECEVFPVFLFGDPNFVQHFDIRDILLARELGETADSTSRENATNYGLVGREQYFVDTVTENGASGPGIEIGDSGKDNFNGGNANDYEDGKAGDDSLSGGQGNDILIGGSGKDKITGGSCADYMHGGEGNDDLGGGDGSDIIDGGAGNDTVKGDSSADILLGGSGNDMIFGTSENDIMSGDQGNDEIDGGSGANDLFVFDLVDTDMDDRLELQFNDHDIITSFESTNLLGFIDHDGSLVALDANGDFKLTGAETSAAAFTALGITATTVGGNTVIHFDGGGTITINSYTDEHIIQNLLNGGQIQVVASDHYA